MEETRKIGFYNSTIEEEPKNCNYVFDDFDELKKSLRENDVIYISSWFSMFGNSMEFLNLKTNHVLVCDEFRTDRVFGNFQFEVIMPIIQLMYDEKDTMIKLLNSIK